MRIGYACITLGINEKYRTLRAKSITEDKINEIIVHNLNLLDKVIDYNYTNGILLFRISSDLIPFGSSPLNKIDWKNIYSSKLNEIGQKIKKYQMRVSMHPGQYTVLNSINIEVVINSINELIYHANFLDLMGLDYTHKLILHIGGVYGDKPSAIERFITNYDRLPINVKKRLVIENDDKSFNINDVLEISKIINIPVVYDNLHNELNRYDENDDKYWIDKVNSTWKKEDGIQKIHYSEQGINKKNGSHSDTINVMIFKKFVGYINQNIDIMLEVKDKDISAINCLNNL